ncbi:MAG: class I SAM-dependent methyltransferase [Candidatus Aenigmatarchaeota archaeon]
MKNLIKKLLINFYRRLLLKKAIEKLRKYEPISIKNLVDFSFSFYVGINYKHIGICIKPTQIRDEIEELLKIITRIKLRNILEIGTADGGTLFLFSKIAGKNSKVISIDLPTGYPFWRTLLYKSFAQDNQKIYLIRADSHKKETLNEVKQILSEKKLDFLFIDGDHSYYGVKKDFEMYGQLVRRGGIIAFHDIVRGIRNDAGDVWKFWKKIKSNYKYKEIIKDYNQDGYGIGIVYV